MSAKIVITDSGITYFSGRYLYVVKSEAGCYATFGACQPLDDDNDGWPEEYPRGFAWTDDRSKATHFVTKEAARAVADACFSSAGPRVVRVKR